MISFIEFTIKWFVFPKTTTDVTEAERYFIVAVELGTVQLTSRASYRDCTNTAIIYLELFTTYSFPRYLSMTFYAHQRTERVNPKGLPSLTLESLFFSAAELLREKRRVRLRLLAEFLERLELLHWAGRSGTRQHQSNIWLENNGTSYRNTISDQYFNTNEIVSASILLVYYYCMAFYFNNWFS